MGTEVAPYTAISLGGYRFLKERFGGNDPQVGTISRNVLIGYCSGLTGSLICYPLDTVKRRLMVSRGKKEAALVCISKLYREGILTFYRGCLVNALKSAPNFAIVMTLN